jgi:hypothetical protein
MMWHPLLLWHMSPCSVTGRYATHLRREVRKALHHLLYLVKLPPARSIQLAAPLLVGLVAAVTVPVEHLRAH